jgi:hypothetical protein
MTAYSPGATSEPSGPYRPKAIRSGTRRSTADVAAVEDAIRNILLRSRPQTVRQIFYACTVLGVVGKTENEYKQTEAVAVTPGRARGDEELALNAGTAISEFAKSVTAITGSG